jgi:hypothetical protein
MTLAPIIDFITALHLTAASLASIATYHYSTPLLNINISSLLILSIKLRFTSAQLLISLTSFLIYSRLSFSKLCSSLTPCLNYALMLEEAPSSFHLPIPLATATTTHAWLVIPHVTINRHVSTIYCNITFIINAHFL